MLKAKDLTDGKEPMSYAEVDCLKELVRSLPPDPNIVNIGGATGVSTLAFLEARPDCFIFSIDILPCQEELENVKKGGHDSRKVVRLLGDSKEIGVGFPKGQCDLLFIDGDHWGAGKDVAIWQDKVTPSGIIAFHDWQPNGCAPNNPGSVTEDVRAWHKKTQFEQIAEVERVIAFQVPGWNGIV
jgi:predicted O-methyltransferase YrrM